MKSYVVGPTLLVLTASCTLVDNPNLAGATSTEGGTGGSTSTGSEQGSGTASTSTGSEQGSSTTLVLTSTDTSGSSDGSDSGTTDGATCRDGVRNGDETDVDCGGQCGATCMPGDDCSLGTDCITGGCSSGLCNDVLSVTASPACSDYDGSTPAPLSAVAAGGSGTYAFSWTPNDGSLGDPDMAMTSASPAGGQQLYTVMVDDGLATAQDDVQVVNTEPFDLQNDCTLYTAFGGALPPIGYDMTGTQACNTSNGDFTLGVCSGVYQNTHLVARLEVTDAFDDDMIGVAWGIQANASSFYSLSWKAATQNWMGCTTPEGILVKRIDAPTLADLGFADIYCEPDTTNSTLLLDATDTNTTMQGWESGQSYTVTVDFEDTGSTVTVVRDSDMAQIAAFVVPDATFTSGSFGWTSYSQMNACVGPFGAACL